MTIARYENGTRVIERWNRVFSACSAEPRRQIVVSLLDQPADNAVALPESSINPNVVPDPEAQRRELIHKHLPKLADMEYVEWDTDPFVARRGPRFDEVAVVFEALHSYADDVPDPLVFGCQRLEAERQDVQCD